MKSNCLLLFFCLVLIFGCTSNEEIEFSENRSPENGIIAQFLQKAEKDSESDTTDDFLRFRDDLTTYFQMRNSDPELGAGNVVVRSVLGAMYIFNTEEDGYLFIVTNPEDSKIHLMSNDRARFSINTNNPVSYVTDGQFNRIYSNECHDNRFGNFSTNVVSAFRVQSYDFGTAYFPSGPYESADVLHLNTKVDNGLIEFNSNNEIINCGLPTESKNASVKLLRRSHNNLLQSAKISVSIK